MNEPYTARTGTVLDLKLPAVLRYIVILGFLWDLHFRHSQSVRFYLLREWKLAVEEYILDAEGRSNGPFRVILANSRLFLQSPIIS